MISAQNPDEEYQMVISKLIPSQPEQGDSLMQQVMDKLEFFIKRIISLDSTHSEIMNHKNDTEEVAKVFQRLIKNLKTLQSHFTLISEVLKAELQDEIPLIMKEFPEIAVQYTSIVKASDISLVPVNDALDTVVKGLFTDLEKITADFFIIKNHKKEINKSKTNLVKVQIVASKLENVIEYFPPLVTLSLTDLFSQEKSAPSWSLLYGVTEYRIFKDKKALESSLKKMTGIFTIGNAIVYKSDKLNEKLENKTFSALIGAMHSVFYLAQKEEAERQSSLYLADPKIDSAFDLWNMPDQKLVKELYKLRLPSIEYDKKIYVPRLFPLITKEIILKEYQDGVLHTMKDYQIPDLREQKEEILKTLFDKNPSRVKIRILSPNPLVIRGQKREKMKVAFAEMKEKLLIKQKSNLKEKINGVVIHIHGGGFVSMSSASHRNYLIKWAKSLNMIIFSIDYRLAPEHPYPAALDDVWQAYNWLINYSETILGIPLDKIVLTGDSAGGNLSMSLTLRAIVEEVRVPDGIMLSYPALNLFPEKTVLPSYFAAIDDIILPCNVLKLCLKSYIPEHCQPELDPFLSPIVASDELLQQLPPIRMLSGTNDPLHDDVWKFGERLIKLKKDVRLTIYEGLPHGFLSLDEIKEYDKIIGESVDKLTELFKLSEKGI